MAVLLTSIVGFWSGRQVRRTLFQIPEQVCYADDKGGASNLCLRDEFVGSDETNEIKSDDERVAYTHGLMVHPVLLAHDGDNLSVAILTDTIGPVREILKHETVASVLVLGDERSLGASSYNKWIRNRNVTVLLGDPSVEFHFQNTSKPGLWGAKQSANSKFDVIFVDG